MTTVVALGGNTLIREGERGTVAEQLANVRQTCRAIAPLIGAGPTIVTHGNGPQVGHMLLRHERAAGDVLPHRLWLAVEETQAEIEMMKTTSLREVT